MKDDFVVGQTAIVYDDSSTSRIEKFVGEVCTINKKYITIIEKRLFGGVKHKFEAISLRGVGDFKCGRLLFSDEDSLQEYISEKQLYQEFLKITGNFENISLGNKKLIVELLQRF